MVHTCDEVIVKCVRKKMQNTSDISANWVQYIYMRQKMRTKQNYIMEIKYLTTAMFNVCFYSLHLEIITYIITAAIKDTCSNNYVIKLMILKKNEESIHLKYNYEKSIDN